MGERMRVFWVAGMVCAAACGGSQTHDAGTDADTDVDTDSDTDTGTASPDPCEVPDRDGDGHLLRRCGGDDCDDGDPAVHPDAEDRVGDGRDQNCDGLDGVDADGDGHASVASGGDDCDDSDAAIHPDTAGLEWKRETLPVEFSSWSRYVEVGLDSEGSVYVGHNGPGDTFAYATDRSGAWEVHAADEYSVAFDVDATGGAHIGWNHSPGMGRESELFHTTDASGEWVTDPVDSGDLSYGVLDLAVDAGGAVHVLYGVSFDGGGGELRHATDFDGAWEVAVVEAEETWGGVLAVEEGGTSWAAFVRWRDSRLRLATDASGVWETSDLPLAPSPDREEQETLSLAFDGSNLHLSYLAGDPLEVWYGTDASGAWTAEAVDFVEVVEFGWTRTSVSAAEGRIYVAYLDEPLRQIRLAVRDGGEWVADALDEPGAGDADSDTDTDTERSRQSGGPSLLLDASGSPHVAWFDARGPYLRYVRERAPDGVDWDCDGRDD